MIMLKALDGDTKTKKKKINKYSLVTMSLYKKMSKAKYFRIFWNERMKNHNIKITYKT